MKHNDKTCSRCVMNASATGINFDGNGVCNFCTEFLSKAEKTLNKDPSERASELRAFADRVKSAGRRRRYDCIIGVSGGVDSSWALVQAVRLGLRPLAVHMDNGWNSELAQNNIANLVRSLGVDLYTHVIDWEEYRGLMQAFFDADVVDVELLYDNAMLAVNYEQACRQGVRYILAGSNQATEGMRIPDGWNWFKYDKKNIESLGRRFGGIRIKTFPAIGTLDWAWMTYARGIRWIPFLDYFDYRKAEAMRTLESEYGYKPYPYKHYESIFTRFYQGYLLPRKFGFDKRRVHLGTLVASGQMARQDALDDLERIAYSSAEALEQDKRYFIKKMGWTENQLADYIARPGTSHDTYPTERPLWNFLFVEKEGRTLYKAAKKAYRAVRSTYHRFF